MTTHEEAAEVFLDAAAEVASGDLDGERPEFDGVAAVAIDNDAGGDDEYRSIVLVDGGGDGLTRGRLASELADLGVMAFDSGAAADLDTEDLYTVGREVAAELGGRLGAEFADLDAGE